MANIRIVKNGFNLSNLDDQTALPLEILEFSTAEAVGIALGTSQRVTLTGPFSVNNGGSDPVTRIQIDEVDGEQLLDIEPVGLIKSDVLGALNNATTADYVSFVTVGNDSVRGSSGSDFFDLGAGDDIMRGRKGNDRINGEDGNDKLFGQAGDDTLNGSSGNDLLNSGGGRDIANGGAGRDYVKGGRDNDNVNGGSGNDRVFGNAANDQMNGGKGRDLVNGGGGDDQIDGGRGNDRLKGGDGADTFIFKGLFGNDTIIDFQDGADVIDLSGYSNLDYSDILDASSEVNGDLVIDLGVKHVVIIEDFDMNDLNSDQFIL